MSDVYCLRPKGAHKLAWLTVGPGGDPVVVASTAVATASGMDELLRPFSLEDLENHEDASDPLSRLVVTTTCACRDLFDVDLVAVLRRQKQKPVPVPPESDTGVSYLRKRRGRESIGE